MLAIYLIIPLSLSLFLYPLSLPPLSLPPLSIPLPLSVSLYPFLLFPSFYSPHSTPLSLSFSLYPPPSTISSSFPPPSSPKMFTGKDAIQVSGPPNQAQTRNFAVVNALHAFNKLMDEVSSFT